MCALLGLALGAAQPASAALTVLIGEPFGTFGTLMPNGHASIYLDRVCADGPLRLRMCHAGEPQGVVLARYFRLGDTDWIATPVMEFLYATDRPDEVPGFATEEQVAALRERYRGLYLRSLVPDADSDSKGTEEWRETAGMAYDRRLWGYQLTTSAAQDAAVIATLNDRPNRRHYGIFRRNCANFAADVVNLYFPRAVRSNRVADFGVMSPKQVARSVAVYGKRHPEAGLKVLEVAQVLGTASRSRPVRGGAEGFLKTKRYLAPLLVLQPEIAAGITVAYVDRGRWRIGQGAVIAGPEAFARDTAGTAMATH